MTRFWNRREDEVEATLRNDRPRAPKDLVHAIQARGRASRPAVTSTRLALAGVLTVAMLTIFAAFGGVGYANAAFSKVAQAAHITHATSPSHSASHKGGQDGRSSQGQRGNNDQGDDNDQGEDNEDNDNNEANDQYKEQRKACMRAAKAQFKIDKANAHTKEERKAAVEKFKAAMAACRAQFPPGHGHGHGHRH